MFVSVESFIQVAMLGKFPALVLKTGHGVNLIKLFSENLLTLFLKLYLLTRQKNNCFINKTVKLTKK